MTKLLPGVVASGISGHLWAPVGAYEQIASTTVGAGGVASVTFSGIPQTYSNLQIRISARNTRVSGYEAGTLSGYFNGDTGANYKNHILYGDGGTVYSFADLASAYFIAGRVADNSRANVFGVSVIDILDYTNTNKNKTVRTISGIENNTLGELNYYSAVWLNTSAVTSIVIDSPSFLIMQNSSISLYGIN